MLSLLLPPNRLANPRYLGNHHSRTRRTQALAALPDPDFLLAMYLLPEAVQATEAVTTLAELERHLQMGQFAAFWSKSKQPAARALLNSAAHTDDAVREFIAVVVARTYQRIDGAVLARELDVVSQDTGAEAMKIRGRGMAKGEFECV